MCAAEWTGQAEPRLISGQIVLTDVEAKVYLARYAADFCEWVEGTVIRMAPVHERHDLLSYYIRQLLAAYLELRPIGQIRSAPFVMRLRSVYAYREPDLHLILNENLSRLTPTYTDGPADLCIEIVSPESATRDYGEKFTEYEQAGVSEYWIIDPIRRDCRFFQRSAEAIYSSQREDSEGNYRTPLLPGLILHVPTLWTAPLPGPAAVSAAVRAMLE